MAVLLTFALSAAVTVVLHALRARHRPPDGFRPPVPRGSPAQDRDRERLGAELRALGAADPFRLLG